MAKKKTAKKSTPKKTATTTPRRTVTKKEAPKKRSSKSSGKKLRADKNKRMLIQVGTALLFGALEAKGTVRDLPHIQALGIAGTYGAAGIAAGIYTKNPLLEDIGTTLAILGARNLGYIKSVEEPKQQQQQQQQATSGVYSDVGAIPAAAQFGNPGIVGVDPKLLADAATVLEELSGDDDEVEGDDEDDVSGAYDDVGATYADVSGDDDEE